MPALRLFTPDTETRPTASETLAKVFQSEVRPRLESRRRAVSTLQEYDRTVRVWQEFWALHGGEPMLDEISEDQLDLFSLSLRDRGLSERTVNKHCGYLQVVLDMCGPRRSGMTGLGRRLGHLESVPRFERLPERSAKRTRVATVGEIDRMIECCTVAQNPTRQPGLKWQAALRLFAWAGLRRNDLFVNLKLSHWIRETRCPVSEVQVDWPWGWLSFVPQKTEGRKPEPLVIPLSRALSNDLAQINRPSGGDPPLLGFACGNVQWRREFARIQTAAGITSLYTFKDLRKTANAHWQQAVGIGTGSMFLGHSARGVNAEHYTESVLLMVKAAQQLRDQQAACTREIDALEVFRKLLLIERDGKPQRNWSTKRGASRVTAPKEEPIRHAKADSTSADESQRWDNEDLALGERVRDECPQCGNTKFWQLVDPAELQQRVQHPLDTLSEATDAVLDDGGEEE